MTRRMPNIQDQHFNFDEKVGEYTCKTCGSTHDEFDAIAHLLKVHGYDRIDIILDEPLED